jgi:hypothetical protein
MAFRKPARTSAAQPPRNKIAREATSYIFDKFEHFTFITILTFIIEPCILLGFEDDP